MSRDSDLFVACIRCGKPAAPHGEHHAVDRGGRFTEPVGMGGSGVDHEHERVAICRKDHDAVHAKKFNIRRKGKMIECVAPDGSVLSSRAANELTIHDLPLDETTSFDQVVRFTSMLNDDNLAFLWSSSDDDMDKAVLKRCIISYVMWKKYGSWGSKWYEGAAEMISRYTGSAVSSRSIYNYRDVCETILKVSPDQPLLALRAMGQQLLRRIGRSDDPVAAYESAANQRDEGLGAAEIARSMLPPHEHEPIKADVCKTCKKVLVTT